MAKYLIAIFLIVFECKLIANTSAFYKPETAKQAPCPEDFKETEKETKERKNSESESKYFISSAYQILPELQELIVQPNFFAFLKPSSGYINPAFTPPNSILS